MSIGWALFHVTCAGLDSAAGWFAPAIEERYSMLGALLQSAICKRLECSVALIDSKIFILTRVLAAGGTSD